MVYFAGKNKIFYKDKKKDLLYAGLTVHYNVLFPVWERL